MLCSLESLAGLMISNQSPISGIVHVLSFNRIQHALRPVALLVPFFSSRSVGDHCAKRLARAYSKT